MSHAESLLRQLLADPSFERGVTLLRPELGKAVTYGVAASYQTEQPPAWRLAQWAVRHPLSSGPGIHRPTGQIEHSSESLAVVFGRGGTVSASLALSLDGSVEFGRSIRQQGQAWPHLLVEQSFKNPPPLRSITSAQFQLDARLTHSRRLMDRGYASSLHAATFQVCFTVQNRNHASAGFGSYLWFVVPIYDDRDREVPAYQARDQGKSDATGMFIYRPAGRVFTSESAHDGKWLRIDTDLLPLMKEALQAAWQHGYLGDSQTMDDYCIGGINLGWEVTGSFDVGMEIRHLSLLVNENISIPLSGLH